MWFYREDSQFQLSRFIFLRGMGLIYSVAFLALVNDLLPLVGAGGLLPAELYLEAVHKHFGGRWESMWELPSIFHLALSDSLLVLWASIGLVLALFLLCGLANVPLLLLLWALYFSFVSIGQRWYSFGWESQLLETGFLAVFLVPFLNP